MNDMDLSGFTKKQAELILGYVRQAGDGLITQGEMLTKIKAEGDIKEFCDAEGLGILS
jgi:hypothetical protein